MVLFLNGASLHTKATGSLETPTLWDFVFDCPEKRTAAVSLVVASKWRSYITQ